MGWAKSSSSSLTLFDDEINSTFDSSYGSSSSGCLFVFLDFFLFFLSLTSVEIYMFSSSLFYSKAPNMKSSCLLIASYLI